ncbi:MAG: hypothetical protein AAFR79_10455 [Pseudomonadota bacterium]
MRPHTPKTTCHDAVPSAVALDDAGFSTLERQCLQVMRLYFSSFAEPQASGWVGAIDYARMSFSAERAMDLAGAILDTVQAMRTSRRSVFNFSNPLCKHCAKLLAPAERHLISTVHCLRAGKSEEAGVHAMLLCEGNPSKRFLTAAGRLGHLLDAEERLGAMAPAER